MIQQEDNCINDNDYGALQIYLYCIVIIMQQHKFLITV